MRKNAFVIAAANSGSGKTTISCALMQALLNRGKKVLAFKCGPDYIDPMFHTKVLGIPSRNLDTFFSTPEQITGLYEQKKKEEEIAVIEGVMGLYDGLGGTQKEGSAYHLAQVLSLPIVLVLNAHGMGRTILPVLAGLLSYDTDHRICGVILNRVSKSFCNIIAEEIERELQISVLGCFPEQKGLVLESRHLGLKMPDEIADLKEKVMDLAEKLEQNCNLNQLLAQIEGSETAKKPLKQEIPQTGVRIGVAKDEVFCFYYEENLELLRKLGAEIVYFSPLRDKSLPENIQGILLGGGYPELKMRDLSGNVSMRRSIKQAIASGMPSLAECGGFLYLHQSMEDEEGNAYPMAGVIEGSCKNTGGLVRFGYVEMRDKTGHFLGENQKIKGHEFHYFDSTANGLDAVATKPVSKKSWDCASIGENHWWGFAHLYYPSEPAFAEAFLKKCKEYVPGAMETISVEEPVPGTLYGIGVGPGDPTLMTLQAVNYIKNSDVLILPAKSREDCYSYGIAKAVLPEIDQKEIVCLEFPMLRDKQKLKEAHDRIYQIMEDYLDKGKNVGFLTIGEPSIYSTYMYVHKRAVFSGKKAIIINGVPSFAAAAARLGISLGEKQEEIHIIPASYDISDTLSYGGTRIYMKSGKKLQELIDCLTEQKEMKNYDIYGVSNCGMKNERLYRGLTELREAEGYLTLVIVKEKKEL